MKTKNLIFLIDLSGSMASKAQAVNLCMNNIYSSVFPEIINQSSEDVEYLFKAIGFSSRFKDFVSEIVSEQNIKDLHTWKDLKEDQFNGSTPTGAAILKVVNDFNSKSRGEPNNLPALIVLISDGEANGENPTYEEVIHDAETSRD